MNEFVEEYLEDIKANHFGVIIGEKGETIKRLREMYDVDIYVPTKSGNENEKRVGLYGHKDNVVKAAAEIRCMTDFVEEYLDDIQQKQFGIVIGEKGETSKRLRHEFDIDVYVPGKGQSKNGKGGDKIGLYGHRENVAKAAAEIRRLVEKPAVKDKHYYSLVEYKEMILAKQSSCEFLSDLEKEYNVNISFFKNKDDVTIMVINGPEEKAEEVYNKITRKVESTRMPVNAFELPKEVHGLLVGTGGCNLKEIQTKCEVKLIVPKPESQKDYVIIKGHPDNVDQAKLMIAKIVKKGNKLTQKQYEGWW